MFLGQTSAGMVPGARSRGYSGQVCREEGRPSNEKKVSQTLRASSTPSKFFFIPADFRLRLILHPVACRSPGTIKLVS